ncbi:MAG: hypothetical protein AB1488_09015 [Nitrospirota bacterium]
MGKTVGVQLPPLAPAVNPVRRLRLLTGRLTRGINPVFAQKGKLFSSPLQAKLEVFFGRCSCRDDNRGSFNNELLTGQAAGHSNGVKSYSEKNL